MTKRSATPNAATTWAMIGIGVILALPNPLIAASVSTAAHSTSSTSSTTSGRTTSGPTTSGSLEKTNQPALSIAQAWAQAAYATPTKDRLSSFQRLAERARLSVEADPNNVELLIWKGICLSTLAGEKRGLGSLKLAREARTAFLAAIDADEAALEGAAHISLGALYDKLPPWPVSFGSKKKAKRHLKRALEISPLSIDAHFFMADFFYNSGDIAKAKQHIEVGLANSIRPGRELADNGRRDELRQLRAAIESDLL